MDAIPKKRCFVISPIGAEGSPVREHADDVYEFIIKPALEACDIEAVRSDHLREPGKISDQMFRSILGDDLCVAVLTGYNPNVFYELAIAQAAARPVIILSEKGQPLPFDIQDLRCVYYDLKIRAFAEKVYINEIVGHVRSIAAADWSVPPPFGVQPPLGGRRNGRGEAQFYAKASDQGNVDVWLPELERTEQAIDILGVSLDYWRSSRSVNELLVAKAQQGCQVRILFMHPENPILREMIQGADADLNYEAKLRDINVMEKHFVRLAKRAENIQVRLMRYGSPHFSLTRTDRVAAFILHLNSDKLRYSPMWHYPKGVGLYDVLAREFEVLWQANAAV